MTKLFFQIICLPRNILYINTRVEVTEYAWTEGSACVCVFWYLESLCASSGHYTSPTWFNIASCFTFLFGFFTCVRMWYVTVVSTGYMKHKPVSLVWRICMSLFMPFFYSLFVMLKKCIKGENLQNIQLVLHCGSKKPEFWQNLLLDQDKEACVDTILFLISGCCQLCVFFIAFICHWFVKV